MPLPGRGGRTGKGCEGGTRLVSASHFCSLPGCSEAAPPAENQRESAGKALLATGWGLSLLPEGSRCSEASSCRARLSDPGYTHLYASGSQTSGHR